MFNLFVENHFAKFKEFNVKTVKRRMFSWCYLSRKNIEVVLKIIIPIKMLPLKKRKTQWIQIPDKCEEWISQMNVLLTSFQSKP